MKDIKAYMLEHMACHKRQSVWQPLNTKNKTERQKSYNESIFSWIIL